MDNMESENLPNPEPQKRTSTIAVVVTIIVALLALSVVVIAVIGKSSIKKQFVAVAPSPIVNQVDQQTVEEQELTKISLDLDAFSEDDAILDELEQTYRDVLDENQVVAADDALNLDNINAEAADADISGDLTGFAEDDAALNSLNASFEEVTQ